MKVAVVILFVCLSVIEGARILSFTPLPVKSHQGTVTPLLRELAKRGHQVTAVTHIKMSDPPPNYKEIHVPDFLEEHKKHSVISSPRRGIGALMWPFLFKMGYDLQWRVCQDPQVQRLIHSDEKFDLLILETFFMQETFSALQHKFGAPAVEILSASGLATASYYMGNTYNPSYTVTIPTDSTDHMDLMTRVENTLSVAAQLGCSFAALPFFQRLMDTCFNYTGWESRPSLGTLLSDKALALQNSHLSLTNPLSLAPNYVEVAGIHITPQQPLPANLQKFMDEASDGVIYFSLGSNIKVSDVAKGDLFSAFKKAFSRLKQKVLWKWETEMPDKPDNVMISKWFPQQDILAHKNCRLFVTHCGFNSIMEAVYFGVPLVGVPFFGDQAKNMRHIKKFGYGVEMDFNIISEDYVYDTITAVLNNSSYQEAVDARSSLLRDNQNSGLDKAVFWTEYVLKHGSKPLRPSLADLYWWQSNLLDVFLVISLPLALAFYLSVVCCRKVCCNKRPGKENKNNLLKSKKTN